MFFCTLQAGCGNRDKDDYQEAMKSQTSTGYQEYLDNHPDGKFRREAESNLKKSKIRETLAEYKKVTKEAINAESNDKWSAALKLWEQSLKFANQIPECSDHLKLKITATEGISRCKQIIENPVSISQEKVIGTYRYQNDSTGTIYSSVKVRGRIKNNCPFPISNVVLRFDLMVEKVLTIDPSTGEDKSTGGYITLVSIDKKIRGDEPLFRQKSATFHFDVKCSSEVNLGSKVGSDYAFCMPDPVYQMKIVSFTRVK